MPWKALVLTVLIIHFHCFIWVVHTKKPTCPSQDPYFPHAIHGLLHLPSPLAALGLITHTYMCSQISTGIGLSSPLFCQESVSYSAIEMDCPKGLNFKGGLQLLLVCWFTVKLRNQKQPSFQDIYLTGEESKKRFKMPNFTGNSETTLPNK